MSTRKPTGTTIDARRGGHTRRRRSARGAVGGAAILGTAACLTAGLGPVDAASAATCGGPVPAGSNCTLTGTLNITGGTLSMTSAGSLTWSGTANGADQSLVDTTAADQQLTVNDATGAAAGWHVTASATTFTNGTHTLANTGSFSATGSATSMSATTGPSAACASGSTCTLPSNSTTYPVQITTAATAPPAVTLFGATANTGMGKIVLGGSGSANPLGWWLNVPSNVYSGAYTSTVTMAVVSAP